MPEVGVSLVGLIRPVLENPSYVVRRGDAVAFHRAVLGPDGEVRGYATVTLGADRVKVYVSVQPEDFGLLAPGAAGDMLADASGPDEAVFKGLMLSVVEGTTSGVVVVTDFDVASSLMGWGREFFKADHGPIPAGSRWITVHPNGEGTKGVPVLVEPVKDGSGHFRVIGGAGGKLNMLRLRGVKSEAEYKQQHAERSAAKRQARKEQVRRDKELGLHESKVAAREQINAQRKAAQREFIATVAEAMGWKPEDLQLKAEGLSEAAQKKAEARHHAELLSRAKAAVETQRQVLVADVERRVAAGLGVVPLDADMDELSVQDLDPVRVPDSSGVAPDFKARAEAAGLTQDKLDEQVAAIKEAESGAAADPAKAIERGEVARKLREELQKVQPPSLQTAIVEAGKAVGLLKAQKRLAAIERAAREANAEVQSATVEPKSYVLAVSDVDDKAVVQSVEDDLRTVRARAFLAGVESVGGEDAVESHVAAGAYNAINGVSAVVGGASLLDRSAVDVLGVAGAAQVLARRLHADLGTQAGELAAGLAEYHVAHAPELQQEALDEAKTLQALASQMELEAASGATDLAQATALNRARMEHLVAARKVMGQALGEMEARASLISALESGPRESVEVSLGAAPLDSAVKQLWALGLTDEDYQIERVEGNVFATIRASGMDKLAAPVDRENLERVQRNLSIMRGEVDEDGWLPAGFAKRPDLGLNLPPGVSPSLSVPFDATAADLGAALRDYIGSRTADGDRAADILADVQSASFFLKVGAARGAEYRAALDAVIPSQNGKKRVRVEDLAPVFDQYADDFVASRWGGTRSTLNRQIFEPDAVSQDALHRALSDEPAGVLAYKPVGDLTKQEAGALRDWFYRNVAKESPEQAELRKRADQLAAAEPERFVTDMFGEVSEDPAWQAWKADHDAAQAKVAASGLDWNRYTHLMRGRVRAFETIQDLIRSRVSEGFAKHYNTLRPHAPIKVGKTVVRHNLNHLGAIDPVEREKRLSMERSLIDSLRERVAGRYASGSVGERIDAQREQKAAFEQAQMGFFASDDLFGGGGSDTVEPPLGADERRTIGHAAEAMIGKMMGVVGKHFEPGKPVKLFQPSMSGPDGVKRQRMIKLIEANKRVIAGAGVGSGKAQPLDAKLLTPSGWVRMGDAYVGMPIIAGDGSVARVVGVYPQGEKDIFRVTMADGGSTECCDEHLWFTTTENDRKRIARGNGAGSVRQLSEIRKSLNVRHGIRNHHTPLAGIPEFPESPVPIDPYLLGVLLGDGSISSGGHVRFSTVDMEIASAVDAALPYGCVVSKERGDNCDFRVTRGSKGGNDRQKNQLSIAVISLGLAGCTALTKFVPDAYLFNSVDVRLEVLRGLMDTDGSVEAGGVHLTFCTVSPRLADGVEFLCRSLGGVSRRKTKVPSYSHNGERRSGQLAYVLTLTLPPSVNPFRMSRKASAVVPKSKYAPRSRVIASVDLVGRKQAQCIAIDHPSHLYVTDDFIVTHNTGIGLGAFSHLHAAGKVRKGLFVVPSIVQGQFGAEALRFLEPGRFGWHAQPGASYEERLAAYKDPDTHFAVVTHQSFRDDVLRMAVDAGMGASPEAVAEAMAGMGKADRAAFTKSVLDHHGIGWDYVMADEAHGLLNREGKENSRMSNVIEGVTDNAEYYVHASGDPVKNDASEAFSLLQKMDGARYADRAAFMRRYGGDTRAAKEGLQRELARHLYAFSLTPDVQVSKSEVAVPQSDAQQAALDAVERHAAALRIAKMTGQVNVDAAKALAPSMFEGVPESEHEAVAKELAGSVGIVKQTAVRRVLDNHPAAAKLSKVAEVAAARKGQQGVVFAHSLEAVESIRRRLEADGHRVVTISGKDSSQDKADKIRKFNPDKGDPEADIIVCSDAGATGANLQSGRWLVQYDTPDTAMTHAQRQGRIHRIGQKGAVELIDLVADHESERRSRRRLANKYDLRDLLTTPLDGLDDTGVAYHLKQRGFGVPQSQAGLF